LGSVLKLGLKSCKYSFELPRSNNFSMHFKKTVFVRVSFVLRKAVGRPLFNSYSSVCKSLGRSGKFRVCEEITQSNLAFVNAEIVIKNQS